jgi:hypothetical protein
MALPTALPNMLRLTFVTRPSGEPNGPPGNNRRVFHGHIFAPHHEGVELVIADSELTVIEAGEPAPSDPEFPRLPEGKD